MKQFWRSSWRSRRAGSGGERDGTSRHAEGRAGGGRAVSRLACALLALGAGGGGAAAAPPNADIPCPADASFCSGFETAEVPPGARFEMNPTSQLRFDSTMARSGKQSIVFPAGSPGFGVRLLVVPIPGQSFWARLFMRTSSVFGDNSHDSVFIGSTTNRDNNSESGVEFSEQGNQVLLNSDDHLFAQGGPGFPSRPGPQLPADTWLCMEAFFDGPSGDVRVFADGVQLIDAPKFRPLRYETFRFGYLQFNDPRTIWFDDVVVAASRIGCN